MRSAVKTSKTQIVPAEVFTAQLLEAEVGKDRFRYKESKMVNRQICDCLGLTGLSFLRPGLSPLLKGFNFNFPREPVAYTLAEG